MSETVSIEDVVCMKETDKALLVEIDGAEHWIPKSVIDDESEVKEDGDEGTLMLPEWFVRKNGLG